MLKNQSKGNTTQQINNYVRAQQLIHRRLQYIKALKKADRNRQDASAFTLPLIDKTNVNQLNQLTLGVN
jgi:hypothetical protein